MNFTVHLRSQSVDWRRQEPRIHHVSHDYVPDDDVGLSRFEGFESPESLVYNVTDD